MTRFFRLLVWTVMTLAVLGGITWFALLSPLEASSFTPVACGGPGACVSLEDGDLSALPPTPTGTGLIVYTGARVVPEAYAPVAERIAEAGFPVFIPRLTANFAIFDQRAADAVIAAHPEIGRWVIAGHSLGGAMAARYADDHEVIDGLVLWAAYPESSLDLSDADLVVASISGSEDGLATPDEIGGSRSRLPTDTTFTVIQGGNHAQFGDYGAQRGDNPATITPERQWDQIGAATMAVLDAVSRS